MESTLRIEANMEIKSGTIFDTAAEIGCEALEAPDSDGEFQARDSEGVVCNFHTQMVEGHLDEREPAFRLKVRKGEENPKAATRARLRQMLRIERMTHGEQAEFRELKHSVSDPFDGLCPDCREYLAGGVCNCDRKGGV